MQKVQKFATEMILHDVSDLFNKMYEIFILKLRLNLQKWDRFLLKSAEFDDKIIAPVENTVNFVYFPQKRENLNILYIQ